MKNLKNAARDRGTPISLPGTRSIWIVCIVIGVVFWIIALALWAQEGIDKTILFYFDPMRVAKAPIVIGSKWLSSSGMAAITIIYVMYLLISKKLPYLDAPLTVYLYIICSYGFSGIAGDLLKEVFARPRPAAAFAGQILALSRSATPALPSGHATKSIALILPFLLLVSGSKPVHRVMKIVITLTGIGVCFSRIVLGAHYLSDVLAGIGMALIGLPPTMAFANMILRKVKEEMLPGLSLVWGFLLIFLTCLFLTL
jgi:membrane-associated phospholipid phosphatase